jgi:hypothetical protein
MRVKVKIVVGRWRMIRLSSVLFPLALEKTSRSE